MHLPQEENSHHESANQHVIREASSAQLTRWLTSGRVQQAPSDLELAEEPYHTRQLHLRHRERPQGAFRAVPNLRGGLLGHSRRSFWRWYPLVDAFRTRGFENRPLR